MHLGQPTRSNPGSTRQLLEGEKHYFTWDYYVLPPSSPFKREVKIIEEEKYEIVLKIKGVVFRLPKGGRPRDLRPDLYVAFVEEDGEEADGEDQRPGPDAQGHRQVYTHLLQDTQTLLNNRPSGKYS